MIPGLRSHDNLLSRPKVPTGKSLSFTTNGFIQLSQIVNGRYSSMITVELEMRDSSGRGWNCSVDAHPHNKNIAINVAAIVLTEQRRLFTSFVQPRVDICIWIEPQKLWPTPLMAGYRIHMLQFVHTYFASYRNISISICRIKQLLYEHALRHLKTPISMRSSLWLGTQSVKSSIQIEIGSNAIILLTPSHNRQLARKSTNVYDVACWW